MCENIKDISNWTLHKLFYGSYRYYKFENGNETCYYEILINHYDNCTPLGTAQASLYEIHLKWEDNVSGPSSSIPSIKRELLVKDLPIFELTEIAYKKINKLDNMEWKKISIEEPKNNESVLVWDSFVKECTIKVFNKFDNCWYTEDGDDYVCELSGYEFWMRLPEEPKL